MMSPAPPVNSVGPSGPGGANAERHQRLFGRLRDKVLQHAKDYFRAYHGSLVHRAEEDGVPMIERKKSGTGHTPLNAAVRAQWKGTKLNDSREMFGRELYRLACGTGVEAVMFAEIYDLFGRYGAGDSDYDDLREKAERHGLGSESARRLHAVDFGIDIITERLIERGVKDRDFWANFGLDRIPTKRSRTAEEKDRERYLAWQKQCERLRAEGHERVRNRALEEVAKERGEAKSTVQAAVYKMESGYLMEGG